MVLVIPFIGIGTGRCGTHSLVKILNACQGVECTKHWDDVPWYGPGSELLVDHLLDAYADCDTLIGDVGEYHLPHLQWYRQRIGKDLKIVCLHRDKKSTVDSMMLNIARLHRPDDLIRDPENNAAAWYPVIDAATDRQAFEFFWEFYELESSSITDPVFHMNTEDLNSDDKLNELCDFLGIPEDRRVFPKQRRYDPHGQKNYTSDVGAKSGILKEFSGG